MKMKKTNFVIICYLLFSFSLFTNETTIFAVNSPTVPAEESPLTKKELNVLKKQGVVSKEITLDQLNHEHESQDDTIDLISAGDHLKAYGLQQNKQDEFVTDEKPHTIKRLLGKPYPGTDILPKKGDILVTNTDALKGIVGHAGIVINEKSFASIPGFRQHPQLDSILNWFRYNANTKVIRINQEKTADLAGEWARDYVKAHPKARYSITMSIQSLDPTYCSKIVWQAYAKTGDAVGHATFTIKTPYGFLKKRSYKTVTPKIIVNEGRTIGGLHF
ncbi:orthopoxovirus pf05708 family protein [Bacillus pumilus]|uniref:orthopoxovirus pf05708 family protein n=1 Tax=Bacillus pumilus TaxID=1408 RepID=UPI0010BE249F|nr:orthopoxovirus pf05708 family protein [Bacillus pumilus]TKI25256.1 orthopoxovirus pf05708 family protein [Bacillus pumilus]UDF16663.1 orthopoxovirus pf05708 family protein [Bacillus pumilus]